jgi:hypothetical protein
MFNWFSASKAEMLFRRLIAIARLLFLNQFLRLASGSLLVRGGLNPLLWSQVARTSFGAASVLNLFIGGRGKGFSDQNRLNVLCLVV